MNDSKDTGFIDNVNKIIDVNKLILMIGRRWGFIVLCIGIAFTIAYLKLRYTAPIYQASITIKLDDEKPNQISDFFKFGKASGKLENFLKTESEIIKSRAINEKTLLELGYNFSFYEKGNILTSQLYPNNYFDILCLYCDSGSYVKPFSVFFTDNKTFDITLLGEKSKQKHHLNDTIFINNSLIQIIQKRSNGFSNLKGANILCVQNNLHKLAYGFSSGLNIEVQKGTSLIDLTYTSDVPQLASDYVNTLAKVYINQTISAKSLAAQQTLDFINAQLNDLSEKVKKSEYELSNLQSENKSANLDDVAKKEFDRLTQFHTEKNILEIKFETLNTIEKNILDTKDKTVSFIVFDKEDAENLPELLALYNQLILDRISLSQKYAGASALLLENEKKTKEVKNSLLKVLEEVKAKTRAKQKFTDKLIAESNASLSKYPLQQRVMISVRREFAVNEKVYSYLLEKKLEVEITKSSITPNASIIDNADIPNSPIYPKAQRFYLLALSIGLSIGLSGIFLSRFLYQKIPDKETIENMSKTPVIGVIKKVENQNNEEYKIHTFDNPKSIFSESIRGIRSSVNFLLQREQHKVICLTSTVSGEGKTFCTINLAASLSLLNKKVIILGCDLRRPKIHLSFADVTNDIGITTYLINKNTLPEIIQKTGYTNLDVIAAGPTPPNPSELLQSNKMMSLIEQLKKDYDYLMIDSAPIGLVSDSLALIKIADINLYILRAQYSKRDFAVIPDRIASDNDISNIYSILNSFDTSSLVYSSIYKSNYGGYYGGAGYYYYAGYYGKGGYGSYGRKYYNSYYSGYYSEDEPKVNWWMKIFKKKGSKKKENKAY
jgi:capsular exopolysaccharide synthesis family protein